MNGLAELITIKQYWQEWADPRLVDTVLHNFVGHVRQALEAELLLQPHFARVAPLTCMCVNDLVRDARVGSSVTSTFSQGGSKVRL